LLRAAGWQPTGSSTYVARARHIEALRAVDVHLGQALSQLDAKLPALDLMAEELRLGQNALNAITGEFTSDDLLGVIFSKFCIGK
jgi:tRNA modification GTPase